jgi:hypothetical protein
MWPTATCFKWLFQLSFKFCVLLLSSHVLYVDFLEFLTFDIFLQCLILFFNFQILSFDLLDVLIHSLEFTFKIFYIFTQRITLNLQVFQFWVQLFSGIVKLLSLLFQSENSFLKLKNFRF